MRGATPPRLAEQAIGPTRSIVRVRREGNSESGSPSVGVERWLARRRQSCNDVPASEFLIPLATDPQIHPGRRTRREGFALSCSPGWAAFRSLMSFRLPSTGMRVSRRVGSNLRRRSRRMLVPGEDAMAAHARRNCAPRHQAAVASSPGETSVAAPAATPQPQSTKSTPRRLTRSRRSATRPHRRHPRLRCRRDRRSTRPSFRATGRCRRHRRGRRG